MSLSGQARNSNDSIEQLHEGFSNCTAAVPKLRKLIHGPAATSLTVHYVI